MNCPWYWGQQTTSSTAECVVDFGILIERTWKFFIEFFLKFIGEKHTHVVNICHISTRQSHTVVHIFVESVERDDDA